LRQNAPGLVHDRVFVIPAYTRWATPYYGLGLKTYDLLAGKRRWEWSRSVSREEIRQMAPTLESKNLRGGIAYRDGQFDDARLAIALVKTLVDLGGTALNYAPVVAMSHRDGRVAGVIARDQETGEEFALSARVVVNATGVFADAVRLMDDTNAPKMIAPSQGVHLVLDREFLPGDAAVLIPNTDDGRVLFMIPWHGKTLIGTTDTPVLAATIEPRALPEEIAFLMDHVARYLGRRPEPGDVRSVFAGLRPLIKGSAGARTASLSRGHLVSVSNAGLVTITGGKWTTYRVMARDAVNRAAAVGELPSRACITDRLALHESQPEPSFEAQVMTAVREEFARTVEDVLARRTRLLFLDAKNAVASSPMVAQLLGAELRRDAVWPAQQVRSFEQLARAYWIE